VRITQIKKGNVRIIEIAGALTVASSHDLKKAVLGNLRKGSRLELVIGEVTDVDLSFIQILAAALKTAENGGLEIAIRTPIPDPVIKSVEMSGLLNHSACSNPDCFWCSINRQVQGV